MVTLDAYYLVWRQRLASLQVAFSKIKLLPKDAQFMQAILVRNACFDFTSELEAAFEVIVADFVRRQDELFLGTVDEMYLVAFGKKPWPLDSELPARLTQHKKEIRRQVVEWAQQAADYEKSVLDVLECYKSKSLIVVKQLALVYGVSPRERKRKR